VATQVARNFAAELNEAGRSLRFLIRDRDTKLTVSLDHILSSIGVQTIVSRCCRESTTKWSRQSRRTVCTQHSTNVFARGERTDARVQI
jgi:hypothetical protein